MNFATWIRDSRMRLGETQEELALALNRTSTMVSRWENGHVTPSYPTLLALSRHFKQPIPVENDYDDKPNA